MTLQDHVKYMSCPCTDDGIRDHTSWYDDHGNYCPVRSGTWPCCYHWYADPVTVVLPLTVCMTMPIPALDPVDNYLD